MIIIKLSDKDMMTKKQIKSISCNEKKFAANKSFKFSEYLKGFLRIILLEIFHLFSVICFVK